MKLEAIREALREPAVPKRLCTICLIKNEALVPATVVATAPDHLQWFECDAHEGCQHPDYPPHTRLAKMPLRRYFEAADLVKAIFRPKLDVTT